MMKAIRDRTSDSARHDVEFEEFYRREHVGQVRRAALMVGRIGLAEDLVHDAFIAVYDRWNDLDNPGAYLNRAVLNGCRDHGRRQDSQHRALARLDTPGRSADHDILWDVLGRLPFSQRAAVVLRYYGGLTEADIAAELDCPQGSVGPWISRALTTMREELT